MTVADPIHVGDVAGAARRLLDAEAGAQVTEPLTAVWDTLDLTTAYAIQAEALRLRIARGETVVGVKLGLTSRAKQVQMGISLPTLAWLTDAMVLPLGQPLARDRLIHPRVEPEIAFVMGEDLRGPGIVAARAMAAVAQVHCALEIIDSRFAGFRFRVEDAVADNSSSARFIVNPLPCSPVGLDLLLETCVLEVGGEAVDRVSGAAVQGHPAEALALAANDLGGRGIALQKGWIVLTGGMTDAVVVPPLGNVVARFSSLGTVTLPEA